MPENNTRGWDVAAIPSHQLAALRAFLQLRQDENNRMAARRIADDSANGPDTLALVDSPNVNGAAFTRTVPTMRHTTSGMADCASQVMPVSGLHILPVFGRGEATVPYVGDRRPMADVAALDAGAWAYVAAHTMGDAFAARALSVIKSEALQNKGGRFDYSRKDDVMSVARELFVGRVADLNSREDVVRIYDVPMGRVDLGERDTVTDENGREIAQWLAPRPKRCNACEGCLSVESPARASKWSVTGCEAPEMTIDAVTPNALLGRALWQAAADESLATSAVYATRSKYFRRNLTAEVAIADDVNRSGGEDALRYVPDGAADLVRFIAAALRAIGEDDNVSPANGGRGMSPTVRAILCRAMGAPDSKMGAEMALKRARNLWPTEAGTRRDAAALARAERERQWAERRNARKREARAARAAQTA